MRPTKLQRPGDRPRRRGLALLGTALVAALVSHAPAHMSASRRQCPRIDCQSMWPVSDLPVVFSVVPASGGWTYKWHVDVGTIMGPDDTPSIEVGNLGAGTTCTANVDIGGLPPGCGNPAPCSTNVFAPPVMCAAVDVSCPDTVEEGQSISFTANVMGGDPNVTPTFNWTVSHGDIVGGQTTSSITVETAGLGGQTVTATVDVGGYERSCMTSDSCTTSIVRRPEPRKVSGYGAVGFNSARARLNEVAEALANDPTAQAFVIVYYSGTKARLRDAMRRAARARNYLVNVQKLEGARVETEVRKGQGPLRVELWLAPPGAPKP